MVIVDREGEPGKEMDSQQEQQRERLSRVFDFHLKNIVEMLWVERIPEAEEIEACMTSYFKELQGFLLAFHGTMFGAGPMLLSTMQESVKKVVDNSFRLMRESVQSYGRSGGNTKKLSVFVGAVWEVCLALKKTPATNSTAIGRSLTQIAVTDGNSTRHEAEIHDEDDEGSGGDICNALSPEEMAVAKASIDVVSETLLIVKELIGYIAGLLKIESTNSGSECVMSLEKLLKLCQEIGLQFHELGACLYPPQEVPSILAASGKVSSALHDLENEWRVIGGTSSAFLDYCGNLKSKLKHLEHEMDCSQVEQQLQSVSVSGSQNGHCE